jgi:hypothetical protein
MATATGSRHHRACPDDPRLASLVGSAPDVAPLIRATADNLLHHPRPRRLEGMIDQRRHGLDEPHGVGKRGVQVEGGFVDPARVDVEQPAVTGRGKGIDRKAAGFCAGRRQHVVQRGRGLGLPALADMETGEDEKRHGGLRAAQAAPAGILSLGRNKRNRRKAASRMISGNEIRHCEKRSDEPIQGCTWSPGLLRFARNDGFPRAPKRGWPGQARP